MIPRNVIRVAGRPRRVPFLPEPTTHVQSQSIVQPCATSPPPLSAGRHHGTPASTIDRSQTAGDGGGGGGGGGGGSEGAWQTGSGWGESEASSGKTRAGSCGQTLSVTVPIRGATNRGVPSSGEG